MTKTYINYYSEIRHLPIDEQENILEKARFEAFTNMQLSGKSAFYFFGSLLLFFIPVVLSSMFFGYLSIPTLLLFFIAVGGQLLFNKHLQGKLIRKGLTRVLSDSEAK